MVSYICGECNYRFESKSNQKGKKCPYCGRGKVIEEPDAEELLNES